MGTASARTVLAAVYLEENYHKEVGLKETAEYLHINSAYLSRIFKQDFGQGLTQYLSDIRMNEAKRLLIETNLKISIISDKVGISNVRYFSSQFKKHTGSTPHAHRILNGK